MEAVFARAGGRTFGRRRNELAQNRIESNLVTWQRCVRMAVAGHKERTCGRFRYAASPRPTSSSELAKRFAWMNLIQAGAIGGVAAHNATIARP